MVWTSAVISITTNYCRSSMLSHCFFFFSSQFRKCKITSIQVYLYLTSLCCHYFCLGYRIPVSNCSVTIVDWLDAVVSCVVCSCFRLVSHFWSGNALSLLQHWAVLSGRHRRSLCRYNVVRSLESSSTMKNAVCGSDMSHSVLCWPNLCTQERFNTK